MKLLTASMILVSGFGVLNAETSITKASGGTMKTELGYGLHINKKSTLHREWITIHDRSLPLTIENTIGIKGTFEVKKYASSAFYETKYKVTATEDISAFEVRFLTFDVWGDHVRTLASTEIVDLNKGANSEFTGKWRELSESRLAEFYASIAYVAQIRTKSGKVLKCDTSIILKEAQKFSTKFTAEDLEEEEVTKK